MFVSSLPFLLIVLQMKTIDSFASTSRKMQRAEPLADDDVLKPDELSKIKSYLLSMSHMHDDEPQPPIRDPSGYCRSFNNCYECVKSMWFPCGWCHNYGCTENPGALCPLAETKADKSNISGQIRACPHIESEGPVLVPGGVRVNIKVKVYIPDPALYEKDIICQVKIGTELNHLKGLILKDVVYCYPAVLKSRSNEFDDNDRGTLMLIWGGAQPYSNKVPLIVYNCETLATDCESCRIIPSVYGCGWCDQTAKCVMGAKCSNDMMQWTLNRLTCENYGRPNDSSIS
ncbi:hypothetical protein B5X24_HaOG204561 [Helicoverpa armigera]|nr:hypothetical protein B5X24_HaOG204561 [Helicoverpa armigera]